MGRAPASNVGIGHKLPTGNVVGILPAKEVREDAHRNSANGLRLTDLSARRLRGVATPRGASPRNHRSAGIEIMRWNFGVNVVEQHRNQVAVSIEARRQLHR